MRTSRTVLGWSAVLTIALAPLSVGQEACGYDRPAVLAAGLLADIRSLEWHTELECVVIATNSGREDPPDAVVFALKRTLRMTVVPRRDARKCHTAKRGDVWVGEPSCWNRDGRRFASMFISTDQHCGVTLEKVGERWLPERVKVCE